MFVEILAKITVFIVLYINYRNANIHLRKLKNKFKLAKIANILKYIVIYDNFSILAPKIG